MATPTSTSIPQKLLLTALSTAAFLLFGFYSTAVFSNNLTTNKSIRLQDIPLQTFSSLVGEFTQTKTSPALNLQLESSGRFFYSREIGFLWLNQTPFTSANYYSGAKIWDFEFEDDKLAVSKNKQKATKHISKIIHAMIHHDWKTIDKLFKQSTSLQDDIYKSTLAPKSKQVQKVISSIELTFSRYLDNYKIRLKNGEEINVAFKNIQVDTQPFNNCEQPDKFFALVCAKVNSSLR